MREIKFRGLRVNGKGWVYGDLISRFGMVMIHRVDNDYSHRQEVTPESVSQFTGLQDKNGVDIYEGDRIKGFDNINKYTDPNLTNREPTFNNDKFVEFLRGGFHLSSKKYTNGGCGNLETYRPNRSEYLEVIGNIHKTK